MIKTTLGIPQSLHGRPILCRVGIVSVATNGSILFGYVSLVTTWSNGSVDSPRDGSDNDFTGVATFPVPTLLFSVPVHVIIIAVAAVVRATTAPFSAA